MEEGLQLELSQEEIRRTILTNTIKMLTERKLIVKEQNKNKLIDELHKKKTNDHIYTFDIDADKKPKKYVIKLFFQQITSISKTSAIVDFLNSYKEFHKIIVVKGIKPNAQQIILSNYSNTEIFKEAELMINLVDIDLVPKYEIFDQDDINNKKFCEDYLCRKRNIPKMLHTDPVARYYNLKKGDMVRIIRPSETTGLSSSYRLVV